MKMLGTILSKYLQIYKEFFQIILGQLCQEFLNIFRLYYTLK